MPEDLEFSCTCGEIKGEIASVKPRNATHVACYCSYCQGFARELGKDAEFLNAQGGIDIVLFAPWRVSFTKGKDKLAALRMSPKGPIRWYAGCCNAPLATTLGRSFPPVTNMVTNNIRGGAEDYGPVRFAANTDNLPQGQRPQPNSGMAKAQVMGRFLLLTLYSLATGKHIRSPFFHPKTNAPVVDVRVLSKQESAKARGVAGD